MTIISQWGVSFLWATITTLSIAVCGFSLGLVIGSLGATAQISGSPFARRIAEIYTIVCRGIPELLVIYLLYFGSSSVLAPLSKMFGGSGFVSIPSFLAGCLAIGIVSGAYQIEVLRGGFRNIPRGELEAALASGMSRHTRFMRIVAPLTARYAIHGIANVWQLVLKDTALVSVIGLVELIRMAEIGSGSTRDPFTFFTIAAIIFMLVSAASEIIFKNVKAHLLRGMKP